LILETWLELPLDSSFCSMEEMMRHDARRAPMTFLRAQSWHENGRDALVGDRQQIALLYRELDLELPS